MELAASDRWTQAPREQRRPAPVPQQPASSLQGMCETSRIGVFIDTRHNRSSHAMRPLRTIPMLCAAVAIAWGAPATATIYCVNSVATLNAAFNSANAAAEGTVQDIRVRPGTYNVPGGLQFYPAGDKDGKYFSLSGGWNSDCSTRSINPAASILNAENGAVDGDFNLVGDNAQYVVEGLSLRNRDFLPERSCVRLQLSGY